MSHRDDNPKDLDRARAVVAQWHQENPEGTAEQLIAAVGHQFHPDYGPVLRACHLREYLIAYDGEPLRRTQQTRLDPAHLEAYHGTSAPRSTSIPDRFPRPPYLGPEEVHRRHGRIQLPHARHPSSCRACVPYASVARSDQLTSNGSPQLQI